MSLQETIVVTTRDRGSQDIPLWEHRTASHRRQVIVTVVG